MAFTESRLELKWVKPRWIFTLRMEMQRWRVERRSQTSTALEAGQVSMTNRNDID